MPPASRAGQRSFNPRSNAAPSRSPDASPATMPSRKTAPLARDAARGGGEEVDHQRDIGVTAFHRAGKFGDALLRLLEGEPFAVQQAVHLAHERDALLREAAPAQA